MVIKLLETESLPFNEHSQLTSLVRDYGYWGARYYLDPVIERSWQPDRDAVMVKKHYTILERYDR